MKIARGAAGVAIIAIAAACSGSEVSSRAPSKASASASAAPRAKLPYPSPARWTVHPYPPSYAPLALRLAGGGCLVVEGSGQRWITRPVLDKPVLGLITGEMDIPQDYAEYEGPQAMWAPATGCTGVGIAAVDRPPEETIGIVRWSGAYGFVGASGMVHVARWPLGPIVRRIPPPEPLLSVKSTGGALIAIALTGRVYRWDEATGYERVDLGPAHAIGLAVGPSGRAAILAAPESVFTTEDAGLHFQRADAPSVGARRIAVSESGRILVEGVISSLAWDPRGPAAFSVTSEPLVERDLQVSIQASRFPSASSYGQSRAVMDGDTCWEASINDSSEWSLFRGKLDGALSELPIADRPSRYETGNVLVAARGKHVALAAMKWWDGRSIIQIRVSHDEAMSFGPSTDLVLGERSPMGLAISAEGTLLVTGGCLETDRAALDDFDDPSCAGGPLIQRPDGAFTTPRSPLADGPAISPVFSPDGRSAYFLGGDTNETHATLYVSRDGGSSFEERPLEIDSDDRRLSLSIAEDTALTVSETGTVGAIFEADGDSSGMVYATVDADGKSLRVSETRERGTILGGFGDRVIGLINRGSSDPAAAVELSESTDGGQTWISVPAPMAIRETYFRRGDIQCGAAGCLVGDSAVRIGWGAGRDTTLPFDPPEIPTPSKPLRPTIVCEPRPGSTWTPIEGAYGALLPDESDVARGSAAWTSYTVDPVTGEVSSVSAAIPDNPSADLRVTTKRLLDPIPKKKGYALELRSQIEGVSLARVAVDVDDNGDPRSALAGRHMRDVEIAWENLEEGAIGRGRIPDAGTFEYNSVYRTGLRYMHLSMGMLSVSPKGIFVRATEASPSAFFVETKGKIRRFAYPEWPGTILGGGRLSSRDVINVGGRFIVTADFSAGAVESPAILFFLRPPEKSRPGEPWAPWSTMLAPPSDHARRRFTSSNWTYEHGEYSVWTIHAVPESAYATAWIRTVLPDGTLGPSRRAPTPYDLGATPRGCTAAEHKDLPRLKYSIDRGGVGMFPGVRHAILVRDPSEPEAPPDSQAAPSFDRDDPMAPFIPPAGPATTVTSHPVYPPPSSVPMGKRWMLATGLVMRGEGTNGCLDALVGFSMEDWDHSVMVGGDLSYGWYFRTAHSLPVKRKKTDEDDPSASYPERRLEARPLTCHYAPGITVPVVIRDANRSR